MSGKKRKLSANAIGWFFCGFFVLGGIGIIFDGGIGAGFFLTILGILFCPKVVNSTKKKWKKKGNLIRIVTMVVVFFIAAATMPDSNETKQASNSDERVAKENSNISMAENDSAAVDNLGGLDSNKTVELQEDSNNIGITDKNNESQSSDNLSQTLTGTLEVHFIDVGQGDSTLIKCGEHALVIDAGDNDKGTTVQLYLNNQNVKSLDAVIWTHPDADHIGGADVITTKYDIGTIYMPNIVADTKTYRDLIDAINYRNYKVTYPTAGNSFNLGDAKVTFLGPLYKYDDDNNNSIACLIEFGNTRFLFAGDAEIEAEKALVSKYSDLNVDVYKAGHHGSKTSSAPELLNAMTPEYVVISCGEGNSYGHPHAETLNKYRGLGYKVYRTDEQGSVVVVSDGNKLMWNVSPSESWKAGEATLADVSKTNVQQENNQQNNTQQNNTQQDNAQNNNQKDNNYGIAPEGAVYIGNMNNQKLHRASCKSLPQAQNQILFNSLEEAENAGYTSDKQCQRCYPFNK